MEALMPRRSRNLTTRHLLWVVLGFFCCALITLGGIAQAGHAHVRLTGVNIANNNALYDFLSTFSGTHYVTPRALSAEIGFHF
jgi:hypothetical protein